MAGVPDPSTIDFASLAGWASGFTIVAVAIVTTMRSALKSAAKIAQSASGDSVHNEITAATDPGISKLSDVLSMLVNALQANVASTQETNRLLLEGNTIMRDTLNERRSLKEAIDINTAATERSANQLEELRPQLRDIFVEMLRRK